MRDGAGAMLVQLFVVVGANVPSGEDVFQVLEEVRIDRHYVFKMTVNRAILDHQDLAVAFDDVGLDLPDFLVHENLVGQFAINDLLANVRYALRTQRIGLPRPTQLGLHLLVALQ